MEELHSGMVTKSGNFILKKRITSLDEFWAAANSHSVMFARHRVFPTAFLIGFTVKTVSEYVKNGWFWIVEKNNI